MTSTFVTAVIGAGAAGTLVAAHLARTHTEGSHPHTIVHIDPSPHTGRGVAYSTWDDQHLLNVPTAKMTALPDEPNHFLHWLQAHPQPGGDDTAPGAFVRRSTYGTYLMDVLTQALAQAPTSLSYRRVHDEVFSVTWEPTPEGKPQATLTLDDGTTLTAHAVVLATGSRRAQRGGMPPAMEAARCYIADPWADAGLDRVAHTPVTGDVLVIGSGLTAVDVAFTVSAPHRTVHVVSRNGWWPRPHLATPAHPVPPSPQVHACANESGPLPLNTLRDAVTAHVATVAEETGDWRPALDGLRPLTQQLWGRLHEDDRATFVRENATHWNVHRHRMSPGTQQRLAELEAQHRVVINAVSITDATVTDEGLAVCLSDNRCVRVQWVIDCRGPEVVTRPGVDPVLDSVIDAGITAVGPAGLGLRTRDGRLHAGTDAPLAPMWTLGALRIGELWETTAMPEIRVQAQDVAAQVRGYLHDFITGAVPEDAAAVLPEPVGASA